MSTTTNERPAAIAVADEPDPRNPLKGNQNMHTHNTPSGGGAMPAETGSPVMVTLTGDELLPCDMRIPGATFRRGNHISTLLASIERRRFWNVDDTAFPKLPTIAALIDRVKARACSPSSVEGELLADVLVVLEGLLPIQSSLRAAEVTREGPADDSANAQSAARQRADANFDIDCLIYSVSGHRKTFDFVWTQVGMDRIERPELYDYERDLLLFSWGELSGAVVKLEKAYERAEEANRAIRQEARS